MLKIFRKKAVRQFVLWGLLILILPAFVMWGSASMSRSREKGPDRVGTINNRKISFEELQEALSGVRTQIILNYFNQPKILDALINNRPMLAKLAWDRIILLNEAVKLRIRAADKEVVEAVRTHPLFSRNGAFDPAFYSYILRTNIGLEPRAFEETMRENLMLQKLAARITKDLKVYDEEALSEYNKEFEKIKISYIMIEPGQAGVEIVISEKTAMEFYESHKNDLTVKSTLKGALPDRVATFEEARPTIEKYLKEVEARNMVREKTDETYKKLLDRIQNRNEVFEKAVERLGLTAKETEFFSSADKAGDIGEPGEIYAAARNLKEFELSKPLETGKGFIIFEIVAKKAADEEAFKKDKEDYIKKVQSRKVTQIMQDWLKKQEDAAKLAINMEDIDRYYK